MLDIKVIRENPSVIRENLEKRQDKDKLKMLDELVKHDRKARELKTETDKLKSERNKLSLEISRLKKEKKDASDKLKKASEIPKKIKINQDKIKELEKNINFILLRLPNLLHSSVPYGKDDSENVEIRKVGNPPKFDFTPKNHLEIAKDLGLVDQERAAKTAGHGFVYLKDELALLDQAILRFTIDFMLKRGYRLITPPYMLRRKPYEGVTDISDFEDVMYKIEGDDLYLIATSEHPVSAMFMDEVLDKRNLPIKFISISPCFRKEVGTHGKYTKGLFRMHQFHKIEQFIFCLPEQSWDLHEELQKNSDDLYKELGLAYRVVNVCTGDIGIIAAKKYDTEIWMADGKYREIGSNSNCTDYQARRLNIKFREKEGQTPKGFVHTLNNTALATSRTMLAILEQYQQKDGSVLIPKALIPYMNGIKKLEKK